MTTPFVRSDGGWWRFPMVSSINFLCSLGWFLVGRRRPSRALPTEVGSDALGGLHLHELLTLGMDPMENVFPIPPQIESTICPINKDSGNCTALLLLPNLHPWRYLVDTLIRNRGFSICFNFCWGNFCWVFFSLSLSLYPQPPLLFFYQFSIDPFSKNLHQVPWISGFFFLHHNFFKKQTS